MRPLLCVLETVVQQNAAMSSRTVSVMQKEMRKACQFVHNGLQPVQKKVCKLSTVQMAASFFCTGRTWRRWASRWYPISQAVKCNRTCSTGGHTFQPPTLVEKHSPWSKSTCPSFPRLSQGEGMRVVGAFSTSTCTASQPKLSTGCFT